MAAPERTTSAPQRSQPVKPCRVLIVGADETVRDLLGLWLQQAGFVVAQAATGPEAAHLLADRGADLLITDRIYPAWEGLGTIQDVKHCYPGLRVLVSGQPSRARDPFAPLAGAAGADAYIGWPVSRAGVLAEANRLVG